MFVRSRFVWVVFVLSFALVVASPAFAQGNRVQICHVPRGNPGNVQMITVSANAQNAHMRHGDHLPLTFFTDADGDGFGAGSGVLQCTAPPGTAPNAGDCNDGNPAINPGADEQCNGIDDNCNAIVDDTPDADGDGYTICDDCNDNNADINPGSSEVCGNGVDDNCDGTSDEEVDADGDGWSTCGGDCCDGAGCGVPELVNPGAMEIFDNGVDDDCDATTLDTGPLACASLPDFSNLTPEQMAAAMEICKLTAPEDDGWGLLKAEFRRANGSFPSGSELNEVRNQQAAVLANYGTGGVVPQVGPTMAGMSTGRMRDQNDPIYVNPNQGTNLGNTSQPPAVYLAANGGSLPASASCNGNCPAGSGANDSVNLRLEMRVPTNAIGLEFDFRFFSSEYWSYACTTYNDFFLTQYTSGAAGVPADKNIAFDSLGNPMSVNNALVNVCVPMGCYTCALGSGPLAGTGMQLGNTGAGTDWLTSVAPVVPGEIIVLELMVFDVSDNILDSLVLLDNFKFIPNPLAYIQ